MGVFLSTDLLTRSGCSRGEVAALWRAGGPRILRPGSRGRIAAAHPTGNGLRVVPENIAGIQSLNSPNVACEMSQAGRGIFWSTRRARQLLPDDDLGGHHLRKIGAATTCALDRRRSVVKRAVGIVVDENQIGVRRDPAVFDDHVVVNGANRIGAAQIVDVECVAGAWTSVGPKIGGTVSFRRYRACFHPTGAELIAGTVG